MERRHGSLIRALRRSGTSVTDADEAASGARYGLFATFAGGMSELIDALRQRIATRIKLRTSTKIVAVERDIPAASDSAVRRQGWQVKLADGRYDFYDGVIAALPTYLAADLLNRCDEGLAADLRRIEYASSAVIVTGHALDDVTHPLDAFGLVIPAVERRKILAVSFASRKFPGRAPAGRVQLRTFVGGALQPEMLDHSDGELTEVVQRELGEILGVRRDPDFVHVTRYVRAMPQYHVGHVELVERIERQVATHAGLELAGTAYRGVGIPDSIHSGEGAAERLFAQLRRNSAESAISLQRSSPR
jgi:oxygen-dependent protoporphyrinogen oxidase